MKREGFFTQAITYLNDLERESKEDLSTSTDANFSLKLRKIIFKVHRDLARLYTLRKEE